MKKLFFLLAATLMLLFYSCDKTQDFALNLLPEEDLIHTTYSDTFTVEVSTEPYTHIQTNGTDFTLLGSYYDPVFGYTKAISIIQIQQYGYPEFNDSIAYTADSMVLYLKLDPKYTPYGKPYNPLPIYVYEVSDTLPFIQRYYADDTVSNYTNFNLLGQTTFTLYQNGNDSVIAIPLSRDLAQRFIDSVDYYFYDENSLFTERFFGFVVSPGDQFYDAAIYKIKLGSLTNITDPLASTDLSYAILYYHPDTLPDTTLTYKFSITTLLATNFTILEHDYSTSDVFNPAVDSVVYLQTGGTRIRIKMPYLYTLKDKVIHKAELIFKLEDPVYTQETSFPAPDKIYLMGFYQDSILIPIMLDDYRNPTTGEYNGFQRVINEYTINVTRIVQRLVQRQLDNTDTTEYALMDYFSDQKFTRAVLTTQHNSDPLKLVIFYSDY